MLQQNFCRPDTILVVQPKVSKCWRMTVLLTGDSMPCPPASRQHPFDNNAHRLLMSNYQYKHHIFTPCTWAKATEKHITWFAFYHFCSLLITKWSMLNKPESTGYSALPSPPRLMQRAVDTWYKQLRGHTHNVTAWHQATQYLRSLSGGKGNSQWKHLV